VRVVRSPGGIVLIDPTGRMPGRGAYLCRDDACWDLAGRKRALERALKVQLPHDIAATLAAGPAALPAPTTERTTRVDGAPTGSPDAQPDHTQEGGPHGSK
jgi:predicted RNA-binding protein YlxR (DUF448 family)